MIAAADPDHLIADALTRVPVGARDTALELGCGTSAAVAGRFASVQFATVTALSELPDGGIQFIAATRVFEDDCTSALSVLRQAARLLCEHGVVCARFQKGLALSDLADLARDLDFQILLLESTRWTSLIWRKRAPGWRLPLAGHAALSSSKIIRIANAYDQSPLVPSRGRYAVISISVEGLPMDVDVLDLEVLAGGARANAISVSEPDARGLQQVVAQLPAMEQTGLVPVELQWFGERLTAEPAYVRVVPPGPIVPRIVGVSGGASRVAGITVSIEDLTRPDELTALLDGVAVWGLETQAVDAQCYDVRLFLPEDLAAGVHEIQLIAGRRKLEPFTIEIS